RLLLPPLHAEVGPAGEAGGSGGGLRTRGGGLPAARGRGRVRAAFRRRGGAGVAAGRAGAGSGGHGREGEGRREGGRREGAGGGTALQARRPPLASRRRGGSGRGGGIGV